MQKILLLLVAGCLMNKLNAQLFLINNNTTDDVVTAPSAPAGAYSGCAWIDYDNDGWLDLFWVRGGLFHNNNNGTFTKVTNSHMRTDAGFGTTWSDFNNDGYIDGFVSGGNSRGSSLHKNNGDGTFTKIIAGALLDSLSLRGWGTAFGDFDNSGYTDIVIAAPYGFAGVVDGNKLLVNNGDESFFRLDTSIICQGTAPYTIPSWSDYDHDGDIDCFIGAGPANGTVAKDYLYQNQLKENGALYTFTKITTAPIATDLLDGQIWNWIDFDNDRDLDAYVTNYVGTSGGIGMPNNLYRNDDGVFIKMSGADVGPIVTDKGLSLSSVWEDFDNDGDLDCFVTNDGEAENKFYENNAGVFTAITSEPLTDFIASCYGAAAGDYDKDGDLDVFVSGTGDGKNLYINTASTNGNTWINIELKGLGVNLVAGSNKSAIGALVSIKANIHGEEVWQMREISAQNSFNSMNSLQAEFGLADAVMVDSLIVEWPSGIIDYCSALSVNHFYTMVEGSCPENILPVIDSGMENNTFLLQPNPVHNALFVQIQLTSKTPLTIDITDASGKNVLHTLYARLPLGEQILQLEVNDLLPGIYYCTVSQGSVTQTKLFTKH